MISSDGKVLNIAFCVPDMIVGGLESVLVRTVDELKKNPNVKIHIITHQKIKEPVYVDWLKKNSNKISCFTYYPIKNFVDSVAKYTDFFPLQQIRKQLFGLYKRVRRLIVAKSKKLDAIDVFIDYKNCSFYKELLFFNKPKVAWIHAGADYIAKNKIEKRLALYDKIVGLTDEFVSDFKKLYPLYSNKVLKIYNPIDVQKINSLAEKGPSFSGKYFCHVSRLENVQKDLKTLMYAFDDFYLKNNQPDVKLLLVGEGPQERELKKIAAGLASGKQIVFVGKTKNPFGYMKGSIANILSSKMEGLPTVVVESLALKKLTISADCKSGPYELLQGGKSGILFKVGDVEELSNIMTKAYKGLYDVNMARNSEIILEQFKPEKITSQIMELVKCL